MPVVLGLRGANVPLRSETIAVEYARPANTPAVLVALAHHCLKATFFPIGKHITYHPEIFRQVAAAGHTIGSHTGSHADLSKKSFDDAKAESSKGSARYIGRSKARHQRRSSVFRT